MDVELGAVDSSQATPKKQNEVHFAEENDVYFAEDIPSSPVSRARSSSPFSESNTDNSYVPPTRTIDVDNPGPWALYHHKDNFITELRVPKPSYTHDLLERFRKLFTSKPRNQDIKEPEWEERRFRMSLAELQRMKLRKLQISLVGKVVSMSYSNRESEGWVKELQDYVQALQEYDYMIKRSRESIDPFIITGERFMDHKILQRAMGGSLADYFAFDVKYNRRKSIQAWAGKDDIIPIGGTRDENIKDTEWESFRNRLQMAVFAGVFLVGPMWLMVLYRTKYSGLVATTFFVAVFGLIMSKFLEKELDVLSSTAAYAAVLVVFVGLTN